MWLTTPWLPHVRAQVSTDWVGLIDEWALRFFHELDYKREAQNSSVFAQQMAHLEGISVCEVFPELSTRVVLTTAWVQGPPSLPLAAKQRCCSLVLVRATSNVI